MQERLQEMELHFLPKKKEQNERTIFDDNDNNDDNADADTDNDDADDTDNNNDHPLLR